MQVKRKELLNKYDEEIYGEKKKMFSLGRMFLSFVVTLFLLFVYCCNLLVISLLLVICLFVVICLLFACLFIVVICVYCLLFVYVVGEGGTMDTSAEREKEIIRQRLLDKQVSPSNLCL